MFKTINELAVLYDKIEKGIATEDERFEYQLTISTACMREDVLIQKIKDEARKLKN